MTRRLLPLFFLAFAAFHAQSWAGAVQVSVADASGKALVDAVAFLESPEAKAASRPQTGIEIEQINRQFSPRVAIVPIGSSVTFPNKDVVRHHVYSFSPAKTFELKLYNGTPSVPVVFDKPGVATLGCNIHDLMLSWVLIVETPYFGKSDPKGQVSIPAVPAGNYKLRVWHPNLPPGAPLYEQAVTVGAAPLAVQVAMKGLVP